MIVAQYLWMAVKKQIEQNNIKWKQCSDIIPGFWMEWLMR